MTRPPQVPSQKRKMPQRLLRDDTELIRQRPEENWDVVDALVVRDEHIRTAGNQSIQPDHVNADTSRSQNQARPGLRAPVREVPALLEQARPDRQRAQHHRVHTDGRNQEEDGPPPVIRRNNDPCDLLANGGNGWRYLLARPAVNRSGCWNNPDLHTGARLEKAPEDHLSWYAEYPSAVRKKPRARMILGMTSPRGGAQTT